MEFTKMFIDKEISGDADPADVEIFNIEECDDIATIRLYVNNKNAGGGDPLTAVHLYGSFDRTNWIEIDSSGIATAFGTLAAQAFATKLETDLYYPFLKFTIKSAEGAIVDVGLLVARTDVV